MEISLSLLEKTYGAEALEAIAKAFMTLESHGIYDLVIEANKQPILESFDSDPEALTQKIILVQQTNRFLLTMREIGKTITERYIPNA